MTIFDQPSAGCFSLPQLAVITAWGAARPQGFGVRIMTDHEDYPELAELYRHDRVSPLWFLNATLAGAVVITKVSDAEQELGTVEEALARVLELERPAPDAALEGARLRAALRAPSPAHPRLVTVRVGGVPGTRHAAGRDHRLA